MKKTLFFIFSIFILLNANAQWKKKESKISGKSWIETTIFDENENDANLDFRIYKNGKSYYYAIFHYSGSTWNNEYENTLLELKNGDNWDMLTIGPRDGKTPLSITQINKMKNGTILKLSPVGAQTLFLNLSGFKKVIELL